jgi:hypothetical protein
VVCLSVVVESHRAFVEQQQKKNTFVDHTTPSSLLVKTQIFSPREQKECNILKPCVVMYVVLLRIVKLTVECVRRCFISNCTSILRIAYVSLRRKMT